MNKTITNNDNRGEMAICNILIVGICITLVFAFVGLILYIITGQPNTAKETVVISQIPSELLKLNPTAFFSAGIFMLILTPALRVLVAIVVFALNHEYKYIFISAAVFLLMVFSYFFAA